MNYEYFLCSYSFSKIKMCSRKGTLKNFYRCSYNKREETVRKDPMLTLLTLTVKKTDGLGGWGQWEPAVVFKQDWKGIFSFD